MHPGAFTLVTSLTLSPQDKQMDDMDKQVERARIQRERIASAKEERVVKSLLVKLICE